MARKLMRRALLIAGALAFTLPATGAAQSVPYDRYLNYSDLTQAARSLAGQHRGMAELSSLGTTDGGRDIWLLTLGRRQGEPLEQRPALLVVANIEGNHLIGSSAALYTADYLLTNYGSNEDVTRLLDQQTVYVIPRVNPDGAELAFTMTAYELPYKPHPSDPSKGGLNIREIGADLNNDGLVTLMRVPDPDGRYMADPDEPRLLRRANRAQAERGVYSVMVEGIDPANLDAYVQSGSDGVNLNRNFQHEYLYFQPHVGPHMISEVESKAMVDFVFDNTNIAAVLTFSPYDNLRSPPPAQRRAPDGVRSNPPTVPTNILGADRPFYEYISEQFRSITGLDGDGEDNEAGSFPQFAYYQAGLPSFTTPVWTLPAPTGRDTRSRDRRWLEYFDEMGIDGFVDWQPAQHPILGEVEVGGFKPNARVNPPPAMIQDLARKHAEFAVWLGQQLPRIEVVETQVESRGEGVYLVTATLANEQYLPTHLSMGTRARYNRPITVRLLPQDNLKVLTGNIQQQFARLEGMGARSERTWLVQAPAGTTLTMEVFSERAGGLQSIPITLR